MKNSTMWWILLVIVMLGVVWYFYRDQFRSSSVPTETSTTTVGLIGDGPLPMNATVTYGPGGFSPVTVTIRSGDTVTFVNEGTGRMWVASAVHPTHEGYSGTSLQEHCPDIANVAFDQCENGAMYTVTFNKIGTWGYHNHSNYVDRGTVIVQ